MALGLAQIIQLVNSLYDVFITKLLLKLVTHFKQGTRYFIILIDIMIFIE